MKSILALLVLVAVANAGVIKSGGLKGSWHDEIVVNNADGGDLTAPTIGIFDDNDILSDYYNSFGGTFAADYNGNVTEYLSQGETAYLIFQFQITNELTWGEDYTYNFEDASTNGDGGFEIVYWTGLATAPVMIPTACSVDEDDLNFYCYVYVRRHSMAGTYAPMITLWDRFGNWASYSFIAVAADADFTLDSVFPDMIAPMVTAEDISEPNIELGTDDVLQTNAVGGQTIISATINDNNYYFDNTDTDAANYDENSSGIYQVWATLTTTVDEEDVSADIMLYEQEILDSETGATRYSAGLAFANFAEPAEYSVQIWATDYAGNVGMAATALDLVVTYNEDMLEENGGVFACQTLTLYVDSILDYDNEVTVSNAGDSYDYAYLNAGCTEKTTTSDNYLAVSYVSDAYDAEVAGEEEERMLVSWDYYAGNGYTQNFGAGVSWSSYDEDWSMTWANAPATSLGADTWWSYLYVVPGTPEGSLWLNEVVTITATGGIQNYNLAQGAASAVAPSVFAVAFAAAFALFRL